MRILMLGWEFPPFISGGLGTACYGLTKALSRGGVEVLFVLPKAVEDHHTDHVRLIAPGVRAAPRHGSASSRKKSAPPPQPDGALSDHPQTYRIEEFPHVTFKTIPSRIVSPYQNVESPKTHAELSARYQQTKRRHEKSGIPISAMNTEVIGGDYSGDILAEALRYADLCCELTRGEEFDAIHAHDWMTFPAGLKLSRISGKPMIAHVHSTEFDRSGEGGHPDIREIEASGLHAAAAVICVSHLTRNTCVHRYGVSADKIHVSYNGVETTGSHKRRQRIGKSDKLVLFLGRITMQKGPEYFVAAAKRVLEKVKNVKFVMAGSGDMVDKVFQMAADMGIGHKVVFTGFLRGEDVERVFQMADVYVMPSVSEPFGIAPLEAIRHDVPVIISRNSGVAEVLRHVLKVDVHDVDEMANKIVAVLRYPPLGKTLRHHADIEVKSLTWDDAAARCMDVYESLVDSGPSPS